MQFTGFLRSAYPFYIFSICSASARIPGMVSPLAKLPDITQTEQSR